MVMGQLLSYSINVSILLLSMYLIYKWLLSKETFHLFNRIAILFIYVSALLIIPFVECINSSDSLSTINVDNINANMLGEMKHITIGTTTPFYIIILLLIYLSGCVLMTIKSLFIWFKILRIVHSGEKQFVDDYTLVIIDNKNIAPFSWFRYIVMNRYDYQQAGEMIITHETQHLRCKHWIDLLFAELMVIFNWFNPAAWLLREELKTIHEYQADMAVLNSGVDARNYQLLSRPKKALQVNRTKINLFSHLCKGMPLQRFF